MPHNCWGVMKMIWIGCTIVNPLVHAILAIGTGSGWQGGRNINTISKWASYYRRTREINLSHIKHLENSTAFFFRTPVWTMVLIVIFYRFVFCKSHPFMRYLRLNGLGFDQDRCEYLLANWLILALSSSCKEELLPQRDHVWPWNWKWHSLFLWFLQAATCWLCWYHSINSQLCLKSSEHWSCYQEDGALYWVGGMNTNLDCSFNWQGCWRNRINRWNARNNGSSRKGLISLEIPTLKSSYAVFFWVVRFQRRHLHRRMPRTNRIIGVNGIFKE
jgi:hypothetical protein